jgi:hypothetical protein
MIAAGHRLGNSAASLLAARGGAVGFRWTT